MSKIRVLVVDDAVVVRRMLTDALTGDPEIEVVGVAQNGRIALAKILQHHPDLVTLDVEMPEMDGLEALAEIRKTYPRLPVVMFSTLTKRGGEAVLDALALGANDYITKPTNVGSVQEALQRVREELIPKIRQLCQRSVLPTLGPLQLQPAGARVPRAPTVEPGRIEIVAIGVSTGGPNALSELLPTIPADLPVPVVIVQHMPPLFTRLLAERLAAKVAIAVTEAVAGESLTPGKVWLAPGGYHLTVAREARQVWTRLNQNPPENSCRPAVDVLFRSVAHTYGNGTLGVVLTGMGHDGLRGCEAIKEVGGQVLVQDEPSSVVWGMPGSVAGAGLADGVFPLREMGSAIIRKVMKSRQARTP